MDSKKNSIISLILAMLLASRRLVKQINMKSYNIVFILLLIVVIAATMNILYIIIKLLKVRNAPYIEITDDYIYIFNKFFSKSKINFKDIETFKEENETILLNCKNKSSYTIYLKNIEYNDLKSFKDFLNNELTKHIS